MAIHRWGSRRQAAVVVLLGAAGLGWAGWTAVKAPDARHGESATPGQGANGKGGGKGKPVSVAVATVRHADIRLIETGLGTVQPQSSVTVRSRVAGQLLKVLFQEGQPVRAGQVLAEIDPRPFQAQLTQVQGQQARNKALLQTARLDLQRYQDLLARDAVSAQQVQAQASLVQQYEGAVQADQGQLDNARLQLEFTRIVAPVGGRIGLRQVDAGNLVGSDTALAVIHEVQPVTVVFTLPEDKVAAVLARWQQSQRGGRSLAVEAWDRNNALRLAEGQLLSLDNQIDTATGTLKLKARFANRDEQLFPNQFVNARLQVDALKQALTVPAAAIQQGAQGPFVYAVQPDSTVNVRPVQPGPAEGGQVSIRDGLKPGDQVVVSGVDKLREGAKVTVRGPEDRPDKRHGPGPHGGPKPATVASDSVRADRA